MENNEVDPEKLKRQQKLWKIMGRETKAGKELFSLYNVAEKPKIDYPKTRPRTQKEIEAEREKLQKSKKCPQKTLIDYPELPGPQRPTFHPVDFIPKRKAESVIRQEIEEYYSRRQRDIPANRGVNRQKLVRALQEKFNMQRGALPKGAELPVLPADTALDEQLIKQQAQRKVDKKGQSYSMPVKKEEKREDRPINQELQDLFEQIVGEIDQRQRYLESIEHLQQPKLKEKIKKEMIERVGELQKIASMKK